MVNLWQLKFQHSGFPQWCIQVDLVTIVLLLSDSVWLTEWVFLVVLQLWMHVQMSWLSNKPELSVKAKQKRMCQFKVTNQSDERISWISVASVLIRCLKAPQLAICCIKAGKCSTTKQTKEKKNNQTLRLPDQHWGTYDHFIQELNSNWLLELINGSSLVALRARLTSNKVATPQNTRHNYSGGLSCRCVPSQTCSDSIQNVATDVDPVSGATCQDRQVGDNQVLTMAMV